ncbi:GNAT family N-acetyltransferase [Streptomyces bullii]|uniref:GNAT family N-acetyltransferase n=1 Tax=Streptomyces bullii TaxID=349910 RepID=A0ABW0UX46_9ACTN
MREFLTWAGGSPMRLWVTACNEQAVRFYERYGFTLTGERETWRGRLPNIRMTHDGTPQASHSEATTSGKPDGTGPLRTGG